MTRFTLRRFRAPVALLGIAVALATIVGAQAPNPTRFDQATAQFVVSVLERLHLAKPTLNDEIAKRWFQNYLKDLDPQKQYFLKPDVEEFRAQELTLDDKVRQGDIEFASKVFDRYLKRHDAWLAFVLDEVKKPQDFTVGESIASDPDKIDYPATEDEARERWRKRVKLDLLERKVSGDDPEKAVEELTIHYRDRNRLMHQFDMADLMEVYLTSLTRSIDPHTSYMNGRNFEDFSNQTLNLSLEGIGAELTTENGFPVVKNVVPGGAADKDGRLQPEDKIVGIEKADGETEDFVERKLADVVRKIRGPAGTKVKLIVQPEGSKERKVYELTRQKIELTEQHAKGKVIEAKGENDRPVKLGVISLPGFYGDSDAVRNGDPDAVSATADCRKLLQGFKKQGVDAVIVDVRGNGGGLLDEAISLSGLFIDKGPVVQVREPGSVKRKDDTDPGIAWEGPLAVLIDHHSASASEIFAGVIKDYGRGLVVGDSSTFGKGTVQVVLPLNDYLGGRLRNIPNLGALKLTIQQFYRANGESTQIRGVAPDIHIPSMMDQAEYAESELDSALKFDRIKALPHDQFNKVPADLVSRLKARSEARRKEDPKFQKEQAMIERAAARKAKGEISLNEKAFRAEFVPDEEEEAKLKKKKEKARSRSAEREVWEAGYYNDEVARIVADYVTLGSRALAAAPVRATDN